MSSTEVGGMLRDWREDRRRSQMDLALDVGVSTRHLSFVETGKSKPSPELVLALAEHLEVPLRERNTMLLAAGYAPRYPQTPLDADVAGHRPRRAVGELIRAHDPYPAVVVDRGWDIVMSNTGLAGVPRRRRRRTCSGRPATRTASRCTPTAWRRGSRTSPSGPTTCSARSTARSRRRGTPGCATCSTRSRRYPNVAALRRLVADARRRPGRRRAAAAARSGDTVQSWFSTNTSIGTPVDITLDELHVELFHPADEATAALVGGRTA